MKYSVYFSIMLAVTTLSSLTLHAELTPEYLGAFNANLKTWYGGGLTYYRDGNNKQGSLFISKNAGPGGQMNRITELSIPELVDSTDPGDLSVATHLGATDADLASNLNGLLYWPDDDMLYFSKRNDQSGSPFTRKVGRDLKKAGESGLLFSQGWILGGEGLSPIPAQWADTYVSGYRMLTGSANGYGFSMIAYNPYDSTPEVTNNTYKYIVKYENNKVMQFNGTFGGVAWVNTGDTQYIVLSGSRVTNAVTHATLWVYNVSDIETAILNNKLYVPQPSQIIDVQDVMIQGTGGGFNWDLISIHGLDYDEVNGLLYGYAGAYDKGTAIHVWRLGPGIKPPPLGTYIMIR